MGETMSRWWIAWGRLAGRLLALAASFASLIGLILQYIPPQERLPWWAIALEISAGFFFLLLVALEFQAGRRMHVLKNADAEGIRSYMHNWIRYGGRVAIWTRDMSWAENANTRALLVEKAKKKELIVCLPENIELTRELSRHGAEVLAYGKSLEAPASRFTITFFGRAGSQVAVGHAVHDNHVIEEFSSGSHPAFYIAEDLINLVRSEMEARSDQ